MASEPWVKNFFHNCDTIAAFAGLRIIEKPEVEEAHMVPCPRCGHAWGEEALKPDGICPSCIFKEQ